MSKRIRKPSKIEIQQQEAELENINIPRRTSKYDIIVMASDAVEDGTTTKIIDDELFNLIKNYKKKIKSHRTQGDIEKQKNEAKIGTFTKSIITNRCNNRRNHYFFE